MGIWVELGVFGIALGFGLWQLYDVRQARRESAARRQAAQDRQSRASPADADEPPRPLP